MSTFAVDTRTYWNERYQCGRTSGPGSYEPELAVKLQQLCGLPNIRSITEYGCGDFHFGQAVLELFPGASYYGIDLSDYIVRTHQAAFPQHRFTDNLRDIPAADLVLCVDVLFHVVDDQEYVDLLARLKMARWRYLAVSAYEREEDSVSAHVTVRRFDPEYFGTPIVRVMSAADEEKYFYIYAAMVPK